MVTHTSVSRDRFLEPMSSGVNTAWSEHKEHARINEVEKEFKQIRCQIRSVVESGK